MQKLTQLLKERKLQLLPFIVSLVCIGIWYAVDMISFLDSFCGHACREAVWSPLSFFALLFLPGSLSLLFVQRKVLRAWSLFLLFYFIGTYLILSSQSYWGSWIGNDRAFYAAELGLVLSVVTILWSIIHTLIIRHDEKKRGIRS